MNTVIKENNKDENKQNVPVTNIDNITQLSQFKSVNLDFISNNNESFIDMNLAKYEHSNYASDNFSLLIEKENRQTFANVELNKEINLNNFEIINNYSLNSSRVDGANVIIH